MPKERTKMLQQLPLPWYAEAWLRYGGFAELAISTGAASKF